VAELSRLCETRGRKGVGRLRSALARYRPLPETRSELERRFVRLCDRAGFARPAVNVLVDGFEVDCVWQPQRLVVELDGYAFHRDRATFEHDRRRDASLQPRRLPGAAHHPPSAARAARNRGRRPTRGERARPRRLTSPPYHPAVSASRRALVTGITGQDGSYLAEQLLERGYEVHGLIRRSSSFNTERIDDLYRDPHEEEVRFFIHHADLSDSTRLVKLVYELQPDEVYNLGAQSHVRVSFDIPEYTSEVTAVGTVRLLEAIRETGVSTRFYQASSSEMFGSAPPPQSEATPFHPRSPYGVAKLMAHWITVNYRESYGMFCASGILFNHESPRRGETFVTRKITRALARIQAGLQTKLYLGNLDAKRDWGYAPDYTDAMWRMLQSDQPEDLVIATGETHSVREFLELASSQLDLDWESFTEIDRRYFRPAEVDELCGDASRARATLGWSPSVGFEELVRLMVEADVQLLDDELAGRKVRAE
jgi:GDPmannose 4,6-dehydratase